MQEKLLTITIPTWNRAMLLEELLLLLIIQIKDDHLSEKVEIIVSNNNSDDDTEKLVLELQKENNFIHYNKNGTNKGARFNVLKCMELATAKYLILFGDDDRPKKGAIKKMVDYLDSHPHIGSLYDSHIFKRNPFGDAIISLEQLVENFFYYIGNAGLFIIRSDYVKNVLGNHSYDFFSPTWPQTQILIISSGKNPADEIHISDLNLLASGKHDEVMIYSSYYLWRTTYFDFNAAIETIKDEISPEILYAAKKYFHKNVTQLFFNILQCGVYIDEKPVRIKTGKDILTKLHKFTFKESIFLSIAATTLLLPVFLSRFISNLFIFMTRGKAGMKKKNNFVEKEKLKKREKETAKNNIVREFDFENV